MSLLIVIYFALISELKSNTKHGKETAIKREDNNVGGWGEGEGEGERGSQPGGGYSKYTISVSARNIYSPLKSNVLLIGVGNFFSLLLWINL